MITAFFFLKLRIRGNGREKITICALVVIVAVVVFLQLTKKVAVQGKEVQQGETELRFNEITTDFRHSSDFKAALPFVGLSAIDVNNDGVDEYLWEVV